MEIATIKRGKPYLFTDVKKWGGKGDNLLKLAEVFNVAQGFTISSDTHQEWIDRNNLRETIKQAHSQKNPETAYKQISDVFANARFGRHETSRLEREFNKLKHPVAVRSSSIDEDGNKNSFAGQHESILGVTSFPEFLSAVEQVYASLYTPRAIAYRKSQGLPNESSIALVVQQMVNPVSSGVAYSPSPNNPSEILIESTWGLCTSVVDGRPCDIYRVLDTITGNTIDDISNKKREMDVFNRRKKRVETVSTSARQAKSSSLSQRQILRIAQTVKSIERAYGMPMDMEFAFEEEIEEPYVLQARPITGLNLTEKKIILPNIEANKILAKSKNTRNQGIFEGPAVVVRGVDHVNKRFDIDGDLIEMNRQYSNGYILIAPEVPPQLEQHVTNARGMYATECGTTGHAAAIAVEKGIIYLGRGASTTPNLLSTLKSGTKVGIAVSKDEGIVYLS